MWCPASALVNPFKMKNAKIKMQNDRATVNKKLKCKEQR
jgi:hypothetical protein